MVNPGQKNVLMEIFMRKILLASTALVAVGSVRLHRQMDTFHFQVALTLATQLYLTINQTTPQPVKTETL